MTNFSHHESFIHMPEIVMTSDTFFEVTVWECTPDQD